MVRMICHLFSHSRLFADRSATRRLCSIAVFLSWIVLYLCSCATPHRTVWQPQVTSPAGLSEKQKAEAQTQHQAIVQLTDNVLRALAVRRYDQLEQFLDPSEPKPSGRDIAQRLLGPRFETLIIDRWDARQVEIAFDPSLTQAKAHVLVHYRPAPNRKVKVTTFVLLCRRSDSASPCLLDVR